MLYLEDYLELIEHLPLELRDRFTDIRERDLQVHNSTEQLSEKVKLFFAEAKKLKPEQRQCEYEKLIEEYQETMKYADDKVRIAKQMHDIMIKLVQKLDTELEKFKLELEADHAGITEELEKRSLKLDADSRLDELINDHLNNTNNSSCSSSTATTPTVTITQTPIATTKLSKLPSGIKNRRRSEQKHRHHPYQNNLDNGYHGRAKLSNHEQHPQHNSSRDSLQHNQHPHQNNNNNNNNNHHHHQRQGSKSNPLGAGLCRQQAALSPPQLNVSTGSNNNSFSAPGSIAGDLNGIESSGHYESNLLSAGANISSFKNNSSKYHQTITGNHLSFSQQHSALSAALASATTLTSTQLNTVTALAMMNANSVQNKISTDNNNMKGSGDLIDPNSPLVRQNPLAAAASQAIAATQQLQQGRRTPSLKASFAAINAAGLGPLDSLASSKQHNDTVLASSNNRNALAPMAPDQQALSRYSNQYGKIGANSNGNSSPLYISVTKSGRQTKRPKHHASHLYPDESPTSISSDNSVFENSESLSSTDYIETGTKFSSTSPSSLDFSSNAAQGNTTLYHRDETKYCVCRQISYGEMVACDNDECEIEWFHYDCVGITQPPKGKWFCPDCTRKMNGHNQQQQQQQLNLNHTSLQQHQHQQQQQQQQQQSQTQKKRGRKEKSLFNIVNNSMDTSKPKAERGIEHGKSIV